MRINRLSLKLNKQQLLKINNDSIRYIQKKTSLSDILKNKIKIKLIENYYITIDSNDDLNYGGYYCIKLFNQNQIECYRLCFSFEEITEEFWIIKIGEIISNSILSTKDKVKIMIDFHEIHPKIFMVIIIQIIAEKMNINEIQAISNKIHLKNVKRNFLFIKIYKYDFNSLFEKRLNAKLNEDFWYKIPNKYNKKDINSISDIYLKKFYMNRYNMINQIKNFLNNTL